MYVVRVTADLQETKSTTKGIQKTVAQAAAPEVNTKKPLPVCAPKEPTDTNQRCCVKSVFVECLETFLKYKVKELIVSFICKYIRILSPVTVQID